MKNCLTFIGVTIALAAQTLIAAEPGFTTVPSRTAAAEPSIQGQSEESPTRPPETVQPRIDVKAEMRTIADLHRRGETVRAHDSVVGLIAGLEQRKVAVPGELRLLEGRLRIEYGRTLPQNGNTETRRDAKGKIIVEIVNPTKDQYRQAGDTLRQVVTAEPRNTTAWILYLRAAANEARPTTNLPLDRSQMLWVHDSAKQLLRKTDLTRQEQAQLRYLLGLAHFELPCGTDRGRTDFAEAQRLFASHQAESTLFGLDGVLIASTTPPELWEPTVRK